MRFDPDEITRWFDSHRVAVDTHQVTRLGHTTNDSAIQRGGTRADPNPGPSRTDGQVRRAEARAVVAHSKSTKRNSVPVGVSPKKMVGPN